MIDDTSFCKLGGSWMQCCIIYVPQFWDIIRVPKMTSRHVDRNYINVQKTGLPQAQQISVGSIFVTARCDCEGRAYLEVVDGAHRNLSILELHDEGRLDYVITIRVRWYNRKWMLLFNLSSFPSSRIMALEELNAMPS